MSNTPITEQGLSRRVATLESEVARLKTELARVNGLLKASKNYGGPGDSVSRARSIRTTVIQMIHWSVRRSEPASNAITNVMARLNEKFDPSDITPEIIAYVTKETSRIYNELPPTATASS